MKYIKSFIATLPKILTDSLKLAFAILGGIEIVLSFTAFSLVCVGKPLAQIGVVFLAYIVIVSATMFIKTRATRKEISIPIGRMSVTIKEGDIFSSKGWRVIGFNEYYDTQVDDVVIDKSSLNGKLIENLDDDGKEALKEAVAADDSSSLVVSR